MNQPVRNVLVDENEALILASAVKRIEPRTQTGKKTGKTQDIALACKMAHSQLDLGRTPTKNQVPSYRGVVRWILLLLCALVLQGCATVKKVDTDNNYPGDWAQVVPATAECASIQGRYANEGTLRDADGETKPVSLTSLLGISGDAKELILSVRTRNIDRGGVAYSTLRVAVNDAGAAREFKDCYCVKQTLMCRDVTKSGGVLGFGTTETTVGFTNSADGSLIGKLEIDRPLTGFGKKKTPWVRFTRARE